MFISITSTDAKRIFAAEMVGLFMNGCLKKKREWDRK